MMIITKDEDDFYLIKNADGINPSDTLIWRDALMYWLTDVKMHDGMSMDDTDRQTTFDEVT